VIAIQGALPIKAGETVIGAVGVSGAPGGDKDEAARKPASKGCRPIEVVVKFETR